MVNKKVTRVKQFLSLCSSMYIGFVTLLIFKIFLVKHVICEINYDDPSYIPTKFQHHLT